MEILCSIGSAELLEYSSMENGSRAGQQAGRREWRPRRSQGLQGEQEVRALDLAQARGASLGRRGIF